MFYIMIVMVTKLQTFVKTHPTINLKLINFIVFKVHSQLNIYKLYIYTFNTYGLIFIYKEKKMVASYPFK